MTQHRGTTCVPKYDNNSYSVSYLLFTITHQLCDASCLRANLVAVEGVRGTVDAQLDPSLHRRLGETDFHEAGRHYFELVVPSSIRIHVLE